MDVELVRSLMTVLLLAVFVGIWMWAWSSRRRDRFEEAALIPLRDEEPRSRGSVCGGGSGS